jgi:hypothetical protein
MALPVFKDDNVNLMLMQNRWSSELNPMLRNPVNNMSVLKDVKLVSGDNVINHLLGRKLQGWVILDVDAPTSVYRSAPLNNLTLTLNASAPAVVILGVF